MIRSRILSLTLLRNVNSPKPVPGLVSHVFTRDYNRKKTIKIPPTKPLTFERAGDLVKTLPDLDLNEPKPGFEDIQELEEAEAEVKKLFSLEFGDGRDRLKKQIDNVVEGSKQHPADVKSLEYLITLQTILLRNQMRHCLDFRKDKVAKSLLHIRINGRNKKLRQLRNLDYDNFLWLLEELKIKYTPIGKYDLKYYGKRARRKMAARNKTLAVYKQKMEVLKKEFEVEKEKFEEYKFKELENIEKELEALGLEPQETLEETINLLTHGKPHVKKPSGKSRRDQLLEKKFEMWAERKKKLEEENYQKALYNM